MSSIKTRLNNARAKFLRRSSGTSTATRSVTSSTGSDLHVKPGTGTGTGTGHHTLRKSTSLSKLPEAVNTSTHQNHHVRNGKQNAEARLVKSELLPAATDADRAEGSLSPATTLTSASSQQNDRRSYQSHSQPQTPQIPQPLPSSPGPNAAVAVACPQLTLQEPTPIHPGVVSAASIVADLAPSTSTSKSTSTSPEAIRRQSVVANTDATIIKSLLLASDLPQSATSASASASASSPPPTASGPTFSAAMLHRKIWVKRPNASATLVQIREDDLVDDVRDMILKKYTNSIGRNFDAPDVTLRIVPRDAAKGHDRALGPEEEMCRTLDAYFPGGQHVNEALVIDVPQRRTPKPSPRVPAYYAYHDDANHNQTEYFPPMPIINPSPAIIGPDARITVPHAPHSIAVLNTGQLPALPSPGGTRRALHHSSRPKYPRHNTASPTTLAGGIPSSVTTIRPPNRPRHDSSASDTKHSATSNNPIPTPPVAIDPNARQTSNPSTPRVASPQPATTTKKRRRKPPMEPPSLPAGLLDGSVPPINVLIVEDNIINLRVLGAFMQRLKVRWQRAMNGKEAVTKWKAGGFHLVLMDIQLPVMNGLEATKEIRRLERVNSIGVFSSGSNEAPNNRLGEDGSRLEEPQENDKLGDKGLFKSPVIIVALTASSLQSDRHEALAAGCNDFLTKPVNFVWLERKVKEWGCMQALIDFDGWRKWKDFADKNEMMDSKTKMSASFSSIAPPKKKEIIVAPSQTDGVNGVRKEEEKEKKIKRKSLGVVPPPALIEENETGASETDSNHL